VVQDTSLLTWIELQPELGERQQMVLKAIEQRGPATDVELSHYLGRRDPNFVRPRRKELYDKGMIRAVGKRECLITGRTAHVWAVVQRGT